MWTQSLEDPDAFITYLNGIHLTIKFTVQSLLHIHSLFGTSPSSMAKSLMTFTQNLLPNINSYNTLPAIPYSLNVQFLSVQLSDSTSFTQLSDETFTFHTNELMAYLHKRGYDQQFFRKEITRAKTIARNEVLLPKNATILYVESSSPPYLIHHLQTLQHVILIPSLPQHIQFCTYCCLPTRQQPRQLSCTN